MKKVYAIPGLGLNAEIFENIQLEGRTIDVIEWIDPLEDESLSEYALRISLNHKVQGAEIILIGHSFGGVLAQEISRHVDVKHIFLISSIKSPKELPFSFKLLSRFKLYRFVTRHSILFTFPLWARLNGYCSVNLKNIFRKSIKAQTSYYLRWSLKEISNWKGVNAELPPITHLHGTADLTFPIKVISEPSYVIKGGDHLMVHHRADEMNRIISKKMEALSTKEIE